MTNALLFYLCAWNTAFGVLMIREQRSAFASRHRSSAVFDDLLEEKLIRLELEGAGRKAVVTRVRHQQQKPAEPGRHERVDGSLDLVHDLIIRTGSDVGVRG